MKKLTLIFLSCLSLSNIGNAATTYVVPNGTVRTTTIVLPDIEDVGIVEEFGVISVNAMTGILMNNSRQKVFNYGSIFTTGANAFGIVNNGGFNNTIISTGLISTTGNNAVAIASNGTGNSVIINNGDIITTGQLAYGIFNVDNNSRITNNGFITIFGSSAAGIINTDNNSVITNNGKIKILGGGSNGIINVGDNTIVVNNGNILTENIGSPGIVSIGINPVVINNGSVSTLAINSPGVILNGPNAKILNTGLISTSSTGSDAIFVLASPNSVIINSGTIVAKNSLAIEVSGLNPGLILLRGSNIQGGVQFDNPVNLTVERGLNLALTLTPTSPGFGALSIDAPFVISGNTIVVIDTIGFGLQSDVVADLSDTLLNGIYRHRTAFSRQCNPCGCEVWVEGVGSYRKRSHRTNVGYENSQGGFIIGADNSFFNGNIGVFGAVSFEKAKVDQKTQTADITTYIGGITYEEVCCDTFFGFALALGCMDWRNERFVMNNLVEGGVERAKFDKGAFFISPEFTIAHFFSCLRRSPILSFTCRYAGCFFGDYQEGGSSANLSVRDRDIDLITTRLELSVPFTDICGDCCWSVEPYLGGYGRFQVGGKEVRALLLNQAISFDTGIPKNLGAFLVGCRGIQSFERFNLFLNFEVSFDNAKSTRILGEGGIGIRF